MAQVFGSLFGLLAVVLGAFGAHALKKRFTPDLQQSFETGIRYQMYHAIVLLIVSNWPNLNPAIVILFISGTFLFSFSIYGLCLSSAFGNKLRFLGPITPLGGLLLVIAWALLLYETLFYAR